MKKFLSEITDETVDLKSLGIRGTDKKKMTEMLYQCYGLKDNAAYEEAKDFNQRVYNFFQHK